MMLPANKQSSVVAEPREGAFDVPSVLVARLVIGDGSALLRLPVRRTLLWRDADLDAALSQRLAKGATVVGTVCNQLLRSSASSSSSALHIHRSQGRLCQTDLGFIGALDNKADRNTVTVGHQHPFGPLPAFCQAGGIAPFFAGAKDPSRNACAHWSLPCASSEESITRQIRSQTPASSHCRNLRHTVLADPY